MRTGKTACGKSNLGSNCNKQSKRLETNSSLDQEDGRRDGKKMNRYEHCLASRIDMTCIGKIKSN